MIPVDLSQQSIADIDSAIGVLGKFGRTPAVRLVDGVDPLIDLLAVAPESGMHVRVERPDLPTVHWIRVPGCRNYLAVYRWENNRVEILRVVHGGMNWLAALESS
ncbi:MAG TPA: type II toxin-antitoxin system RelE/ParE family toxin [Pirellulaceae bacterium]|nr:type II toxin-antitoxin system RelE/ParE family toxin [Pirellulaceae bacterium]